MVSPLYSTRCVHACVCRGVKSEAGREGAGSKGDEREILMMWSCVGGGAVWGGWGGGAEVVVMLTHNFTMALDHISGLIFMLWSHFITVATRGRGYCDRETFTVCVCLWQCARVCVCVGVTVCKSVCAVILKSNFEPKLNILIINWSVNLFIYFNSHTADRKLAVELNPERIHRLFHNINRRQNLNKSKINLSFGLNTKFINIWSSFFI